MFDVSRKVEEKMELWLRQKNAGAAERGNVEDIAYATSKLRLDK
jgi:hypothetical protein